jgi:LPS sulfotransferase NodH
MKKFIKHSYRQLRGYTYALLRGSQQPTQKFLIFFRPRSGSTLLCDLLRSHPNVFCDGEIFGGGKKIFFPRTYLKGNSVRTGKSVYGFKLNIRQLKQQKKLGEPQDFLRQLQQQNWKILYILRRNTLRQAVSFFIAQQRNEWIGTAKNQLKHKVFIDCCQLVDKIERIEKAIMCERQLLAPTPYLTLTYEENFLHAGQHQNTLDQVFEYLGVNSVPVQTQMSKTSAFNELSDIVENYEEMVTVVKATKYAHFLQYP